ncbi:MAG TPA: hypothetical protein VHN15_08740 [Thermoanaerobaculia bacterium]|nr:hypothetical protein [Thermoanaerobaculia bacterium]
MKKNLRKLSLSRETLHTLEALARVAGGAKPGPIQTGNTCDCTLSCPELCHFTEPLTGRC